MTSEVRNQKSDVQKSAIRHPTSGFTLIEVLLTVAILSVGAIYIHQGFAGCVEAIRHSEDVIACDSYLEYAMVDAQMRIFRPEISALTGKLKEFQFPSTPRPDFFSSVDLRENSQAKVLNQINFKAFDLKTSSLVGSSAHATLLVNVSQDQVK